MQCVPVRECRCLSLHSRTDGATGSETVLQLGGTAPANQHKRTTSKLNERVETQAEGLHFEGLLCLHLSPRGCGRVPAPWQVEMYGASASGAMRRSVTLGEQPETDPARQIVESSTGARLPPPFASTQWQDGGGWACTSVEHRSEAGYCCRLHPNASRTWTRIAHQGYCGGSVP